LDILSWTVEYILSYISVVTLLVGVAYKVARWGTTPVPLKIPTTPAPETYVGVAGRMASEIVYFRSLFRADRGLWAGAIMFHAVLLYVLVGHVIDLAFHSFWSTIGSVWSTLLGYAGLVLFGAICFLFVRRLLVDYIRYISNVADYLILALLGAIVFLGDYMRNVTHVNLAQVSTFFWGLTTFNYSTPAPNSQIFTLHLLLVELLMIYLPFSKVMHMIGILFSPTRNQRNDSRARRHINPWEPTISPHFQSWDEYYTRYKRELDEIEAAAGGAT
jgi:nitrate reductase gamma subunit